MNYISVKTTPSVRCGLGAGPTRQGVGVGASGSFASGRAGGGAGVFGDEENPTLAQPLLLGREGRRADKSGACFTHEIEAGQGVQKLMMNK